MSDYKLEGLRSAEKSALDRLVRVHERIRLYELRAFRWQVFMVAMLVLLVLSALSFLVIPWWVSTMLAVACFVDLLIGFFIWSHCRECAQQWRDERPCLDRKYAKTQIRVAEFRED